MLTEDQAVEILKRGGVVSIPTETVYGLAACIDNPSALEKIFEIKERPFFDPLIVHVFSVEQAKLHCLEWESIHDKLAKEFWPGPLTLVVKKNEKIDNIITSSLPTVGLRCPSHPVTLSLLKKLNVPLAAPSANKFTKTSPTKVEHVKQGLPGVPVLDGGECKVGIESTILEITKSKDKYEIQILRPGIITRKEIQSVVSEFPVKWIESIRKEGNSPGSFEVHYQPEFPLIYVHCQTHLNKSELFNKVCDALKILTLACKEIKLSSSPYLAARQLYSELRSPISKEQTHLIFFEDELMEAEEWMGILDRLKKASSLKILKNSL